LRAAGEVCQADWVNDDPALDDPDVTATLQDIARRAGVSAKTASSALNSGRARMAEATRARIHAVAEELGYVANVSGQGLRAGQLPVLGLVADGLITAPFATGIVRGLDNAARAAGVALLVATRSAGVAEAINGIARFRPRGIAYAAMFHRVVEVPAGRHPGLLINCRDPAARLPALVPDEDGAAAAAVAHLLARGRRRIGFLTLPGLLAGTLRERAMRATLAAAGLAPLAVLPATRAAYADRAPSLVARHVPALLAQGADAILCGNDRVAMEAMNALRRAGARVPDDVAVMGFDNQAEIAARLDPPLTTMALPFRAMGRLAADILLQGAPAPDGPRALPFALIERAST
jgi:DNA-binding LacI/PurR family transcriptional regulator